MFGPLVCINAIRVYAQGKSLMIVPNVVMRFIVCCIILDSKVS